MVLAPLLLGYAVAAGVGLSILRDGQIGGPAYVRLTLMKELLADVLPPPSYLVESHLLAYQALLDTAPTARAEFESRSRQLTAEYEQRLLFWQAALTDERLRRDFLDVAAPQARRYMKLRDTQFAQLLEAGDDAGARAVLLGAMSEAYAAHRRGIDGIVRRSREVALQREGQAAETVAAGLLWMSSTLGLTLVMAGFLVWWLIARMRTVQLQLATASRDAESASVSKTEFLANMSHEIRTPMTAILGFADLLETVEAEQSPALRDDYLRTIRRHGAHLLAIINDILDLSKIEAGQLKIETVELEPVELLRSVLHNMRAQAHAKNLVLSAQLDSPVPLRIVSDPLRLRQILINLVGNAVKFTRVGQVRLHMNFQAEPIPQLSVSVQDTGVGIPSAKLSDLFGAFQQADASTAREFGGTGLGLRISQRLAQMLGGSITVTSVAGSGSCFTLTVVLSRLLEPGPPHPAGPLTSSPAAVPSPAATTDAGRLNGVRVLLAEDGADNERMITLILKKAGAEVLAKQNGRLAVEALTVDGSLAGSLRKSLDIDVILTDMQMPELDGYQTARLLRDKGCTLPIVALTAHAMAGERDKCLQAGCSDYVTKPIDRRQLVDTLRRALDTSR